MRRIQALNGSALLVLLIGSLQTDTSLAAERPVFSGFWQLNEELTENSREKMQESMGRRGGRGGFGGPGGRSGSPDGSRGGGSRADMEERMRAMHEKIQTLEITHQEPELSIVFADGSNRTIYSDGREFADDLEGGFLKAKGKWKNRTQLVIKSEMANGGKVTEIYELNESGEMLFVTVKMEGDGRRPDISFRRVYDATGPGIPLVPDPASDAG